ncbi:MAG TPA: hypothetical protein VGY56_11370 [Verrucomicrobiae bacterium]|nr:hypothetical protein [Verrucomicrobiae bacterium]
MAKETLKENAVDLSQGPDPSPKVGDTVAFVQPGDRIVPGKVASVDEKSAGRAITVEGVTGPNKKPLRVVHRPKAALAANTWHWPAKAAATLLLLACLGIALVVRAGLPTYHTFTAAGTSSAQATIIMPADPNSQIRVVSAFYSSDNAAGKFTFLTGATAYGVMFSNTVSSVTNLVTSTNNLASGQILVLQHGGSDYTNSVTSFGTYIAGTNASGYVTNQAFIVAPAAFSFGATTCTAAQSDNIYFMTNQVVWTVGAATNAINGDDIYSGNYGRPVIVLFGPATAANALNISAHYDSAAQF